MWIVQHNVSELKVPLQNWTFVWPTIETPQIATGQYGLWKIKLVYSSDYTIQGK